MRETLKNWRKKMLVIILILSLMVINKMSNTTVLVLILTSIALFGYDIYNTDKENKERIRKEEEYRNLPKVEPIPYNIKLSWDGSVHKNSSEAIPISIYGRYSDAYMRSYGCFGKMDQDFYDCVEEFHSNPKKFLRTVSTLKPPRWISFWWLNY